MKVIACDRCMGIILPTQERYTVWFVLEEEDDDNEGRDLCRPCWLSLRLWWAGGMLSELEGGDD